MADVSGIINAIEAAIYTNGAELITGDILQAVLEAMVNGLNTLKEDTLIFDNTPTNGSDNPVKSGGVYSALQGKQDTLSDGDNISTINGESLLTGDPITINASKSETVVGSLGESLFLGISQAAPHSFRIDINATYNSTPNSNLIGSIIVAVCYDAGWQAEAYYYGSTLADLVSKVAIYEDNGDYYLVVSLKSQDLTEPFYFTVTPLDENTLDASAVEIDTQTLVETITPTELGAGGGGVAPVTSWQNPPTDTDVPSEKLVYDSLGKKGVISQTQTWTQAADGSYSYVMSAQTAGLIPQSFIDLVTSAGATFNPNGYQTGVGYFELNGLTDISYEEMKAIYYHGDILKTDHCIGSFDAGNNILRTIIASNRYGDSQWSNSQYLPVNLGVGYAKTIERIVFPDYHYKPRMRCWAGNAYETLNSSYLKIFKNVSFDAITSAKSFNLPSCEDFEIYNLRANLTLSSSSRLKPSSVAIMINWSKTTPNFTITLHPTAYAAAIADADVTTALAAHTNVTLASA